MDETMTLRFELRPINDRAIWLLQGYPVAIIDNEIFQGEGGYDIAHMLHKGQSVIVDVAITAIDYTGEAPEVTP